MTSERGVAPVRRVISSPREQVVAAPRLAHDPDDVPGVHGPHTYTIRRPSSRRFVGGREKRKKKRTKKCAKGVAALQPISGRGYPYRRPGPADLSWHTLADGLGTCCPALAPASTSAAFSPASLFLGSSCRTRLKRQRRAGRWCGAADARLLAKSPSHACCSLTPRPPAETDLCAGAVRQLALTPSGPRAVLGHVQSLHTTRSTKRWLLAHDRRRSARQAAFPASGAAHRLIRPVSAATTYSA